MVVEIIVRFYCCNDRRKFIANSYNITDVLALTPYFLMLFVAAAENLPAYQISTFAAGTDNSSLQILSIFRIVRAFRLFRFIRNNSAMKMMLQAFAISKDGLVMLIFIYLISLILFSSLVYYTESYSCALGTVETVSQGVGLSVDHFCIV